MDGTGQLIAVSLPHEEFSNGDIGIWLREKFQIDASDQ